MKSKVIRTAINLVQVMILIPPLLLQYLSDKKMGVARYLIFKKQKFQKGLFTPSFVNWYYVILILGVVVCSALLIRSYSKRANRTLVKSLITAIVLSLAAVFYVLSKSFEGLLAYHFFIIAIIVVVILQYIKVTLSFGLPTSGN